jgi:mRNA interferase MazF
VGYAGSHIEDFVTTGDQVDLAMRCGHFVTVAAPGDYGKPRPALMVQSDLFDELPSVVICPLTTTPREDADLFRLDAAPSPRNGLREPPQIAIDKITVAPARMMRSC